MSDSIKEFDKVLADLQTIKEQGRFIPDCSTREGYEASKNYVLKVTTPARTALSNAHKSAKAFYLEGGRNVDAKKKALMSELDEAQRPHQKAYKAVDDERKRIKAEKESRIQHGFDELKGYVELAINQDSKTIENIIDDCSAFDADPEIYGKELNSIIELHSKTMGSLTDAYSQALQFEEMKRQQDELAQRQAEIDAREREARERQEADNREVEAAKLRESMRIQAEQAASEEVERLKRDALESERRRVEQEEQARIFAEDAKIEAKRLAEEEAAMAVENEKRRQAEEAERVKAEAEARAADRKNRGAINSQAMDCLIRGGLSENEAKLAVKLISANKVANVQINY